MAVKFIRLGQSAQDKAVEDEGTRLVDNIVRMNFAKFSPVQPTTDSTAVSTALKETDSIMQRMESPEELATRQREKDLAAYTEGYDYDKLKTDPYYKEVATSQESYRTQPGQMPISAGPSHPSSRDWNVPQYDLESPESGVDPRLDTPVSPMMQTSGGKHVVGRTRGGITSPMMQAAAGAGLDYGSVAHPSSAEAGYTSAMGGVVGESDTTPNKYQTSPAPMAQDLGGWERAPGSKVSPVAGGGDHRVVGTSRWRSKGRLETSDPVVANLRKEGGLVSIPTSERAWKSERVDRSTEPEVWQTSPEVLSSQGKLRDEMLANMEEEASAPPEHWETPSETMLRRAGSKARLARVTKEAGKKIKGMSEYEKAPEHVQQLARGGMEGLGMKQIKKISRRDLEQVERIKAEFVRKRLREAGL